MGESKIPADIWAALLDARKEYGLTLGQMADWLKRRHSIQINRGSLHKRLKRLEKKEG